MNLIFTSSNKAFFPIRKVTLLSLIHIYADEGAGKKGKKEKKEKKEKAKKEKAPKVKKEKPPKEIDRTPPLPKKPVILIFIMALSILILILLGSSNLQYGQDMQQAKDDFASGSYVTAFQTIAGSSVKGKDVYKRQA